MPKFAANLTMLFTEVPFLDRFAAARAALGAAFDAHGIRFASVVLDEPVDAPLRALFGRGARA